MEIAELKVIKSGLKRTPRIFPKVPKIFKRKKYDRSKGEKLLGID